MAPSGKWIDGIDAQGSVADAARLSLESRLAAVQYWLPLAGYLAEQDVEHVHRLRVSTRRAMAALELYRDWLPKKATRRLRKQLKKIRRAAGDARDLDVLAQRLKRDYGERAAPVLSMIAERRAAVQPVVEKVADRYRRGGCLVRRISKVTSRIGPPKNAQKEFTDFATWARQQLSEAAGAFFESQPTDKGVSEQLHQFRIRAKRLRYTIELVAPAFGQEMRKEHYAVVEKLQEQLGSIQDHATGSDQLRKWAEHTEDAETQDVLREIAVEEGQQLEQQMQQFREWWTSQRAEKLRQALTTSEDSGVTKSAPQAAHQT